VECPIEKFFFISLLIRILSSTQYVYVIKYIFNNVPDIGVRRCLGPEGNGVSCGEEGERGPGPPKSREDKQSAFSEGGGNMEKEEEGRISQV
jgi:hypothetical protein